MRFVVATVDREAAWRKLHRRGFLRTLVDRGKRRDDAPSVDGLPRLSLIWLPYYLLSFPTLRGAHCGEVLLLASGFDGGTAFVDSRDLAWEEVPAREHFPPTVTAELATEAASRALLAARAQGSLWKSGKTEFDEPRTELVHYPYWAYYYEPRTGILDVSLLDAWSGQPTGARVKSALLAALAAKKNQRPAPSESSSPNPACDS